MVNDLLLEIGTEEIPAGFLSNAALNLKEQAAKALDNSSLEFKNIDVFYTPRRLTLKVEGIPDKQADITKEITGPPTKIAFDHDGKPTKATIGFAKKQNTDIKNLSIINNERGNFIGLTKVIKGKKSQDILKDLIPKLILKIPFPKSMRWGNSSNTFARPIRWIMCLYKNKKLKFEIYNIKSSDKSYGHRFLSPKSFNVSGWNGYIRNLQNSYVILDQDKRKKIIEEQVSRLFNDLNGKIFLDSELLETVTNIVEYPVSLAGSFDESFLEIPTEVLVSVMKTHQKYFPVYKKNSPKKEIEIRSSKDIRKSNNLLPYFVFVSGLKVDNPQLIVKGNERVIKARFTDAKFFFEEDTKQNLEKFVEKLKLVTYLSDVGSYHDKTLRLQNLSSYVSTICGVKPEILTRAALLCKADLVTQMVYEFPELQGVIGRYYALISGEDLEVSNAIEEHYMPLTRDSEIPKSKPGALLSIVDKLDNICSCFFAGYIPTGSADPYALRRQAIGIIRIINSHYFELNLTELINESLNNLNIDNAQDIGEVKCIILDFFKERFRNLVLEESDFSYDVVDAVISVNFNNIQKSIEIMKTINSYKQKNEFEHITTAFKRVVNITKDKVEGKIDQSLLIEQSEKNLFMKFQGIKSSIKDDIKNNKFDEALNKLIKLREPIDEFFDNVMVMDKNKHIRNNRLKLLSDIKNHFFQIADFTKLN